MIVVLVLLVLMFGAGLGWAISGLLHQQEMVDLLRWQEDHEAEMQQRSHEMARRERGDDGAR